MSNTIPHYNIKYLGCATSHFQSEPISYDSLGNKMPPVSDWEFELAKNLDGKKSGIRVKIQESELPHFLLKAELYIKRSAQIGHNMFRFSFDFARLCPKVGEFNEELMSAYIFILALIQANGQKPMVTMHHFTMPQYLLQIDKSGRIVEGGWEHPDVLNHFEFYIVNVVKFLRDKDKLRKILNEHKFDQVTQEKLLCSGFVQYFLTINEPIITPLNSYIAGIYPPYRRGNILIVNKLIKKMIAVHDIFGNEIKKLDSAFDEGLSTQIGIGYNLQFYDGIFGKLSNYFLNKLYTAKFERDNSYSDFIGLNYYYRQTMPFFRKRRQGRDYSDMPYFGDIFPSGILDVLRELHNNYPTKQIFITEIGFSDSNDMRRPFWLLETIQNILTAQKEGIPIRGILLWTMVNNFEWDFGMTQKLGIFSERELEGPLNSSTAGIRSWEAWVSLIKAIRFPSAENDKKLHDAYNKAKQQYEYFKEEIVNSKDTILRNRLNS